MDLWKRLSKYTQGVILILVASLLFAYAAIGSAREVGQTKDIVKLIQHQHAEAARDRDEFFEVLVANGDFQTCVWTSIVKPKNVGNQKRSVRAIKQCERRFLSE